MKGMKAKAPEGGGGVVSQGTSWVGGLNLRNFDATELAEWRN